MRIIEQYVMCLGSEKYTMICIYIFVTQTATSHFEFVFHVSGTPHCDVKGPPCIPNSSVVAREGAGGDGVSPISSVGTSGTLGSATDGAMDGPNSAL